MGKGAPGEHLLELDGKPQSIPALLAQSTNKGEQHVCSSSGSHMHQTCYYVHLRKLTSCITSANIAQGIMLNNAIGPATMMPQHAGPPFPLAQCPHPLLPYPVYPSAHRSACTAFLLNFSMCSNDTDKGCFCLGNKPWLGSSLVDRVN